MKHVEALFSARDGRESSFRHCGGRVRLVLACLCAVRHDNTVLTSEEKLLSTCRPV